MNLQRKSNGPTELDAVPQVVHDALRSSGQPLDAATRSFFEPRFGYDFSRVRLHTDSRAAESAQAVNALAYTVGNDVVFGGGHYSPGSSAGNRLLAHELTHVVQQNGSNATSLQRFPGPSDDPREREADRMGDSVEDIDERGWPPEKLMVLPPEKTVSDREIEEITEQAPKAQETSAEGEKAGGTEVTVREGGEFGAKKPFVPHERGLSVAGKYGVEVGKPGKISGGLSFGAVAATGGLTSFEAKVEGKYPVGEWIYNPAARKRLGHWLFLKDVKTGFGFGREREYELYRKLGFELSVNAVSFGMEDLKVKHGTIDVEAALGAFAKGELKGRGGFRNREGPLEPSFQTGGELSGGMKFKPKQSPFFVFVEGSFKLSRTFEGTRWLPGVFEFTFMSGVGVTLRPRKAR